MPILTFVNFDEVYKHIKGGEKPLAIYYFGSTTNPNLIRIIDTTSSGAVSANDILG